MRAYSPLSPFHCSQQGPGRQLSQRVGKGSRMGYAKGYHWGVSSTNGTHYDPHFIANSQLAEL